MWSRKRFKYYPLIILTLYCIWFNVGDVEEEQSSVQLELAELTKRKLVVLFTYYRSGSTFTGQLLNQHDDIFYLFEPLILGITEADNVESKTKVINKILNCTLPSYAEFETEDTPAHVRQSCQFRNFCFPHGTKEFCAPPFCLTDLSEERKKCGHVSSDYCPGPSVLKAEATGVCKAAKILALKTIRIMAIEQFVDYFRRVEKDNHEVKFIFLVRDPRGMFNSRLRVAQIQYHETEKNEELLRKVERHCASMVQNLKSVTDIEYFKQRTVVIRYEDVALYPEAFTIALYDRLGIDYTRSIQEWIAKNTHDTSRRINMYSTSRNSAKVSSDWRNKRSNRHLGFEHAYKVQQRCTEMMKLFGYEEFSAAASNFNLSLPSTKPFNQIPYLFQLNK